MANTIADSTPFPFCQTRENLCKNLCKNPCKNCFKRHTPNITLNLCKPTNLLSSIPSDRYPDIPLSGKPGRE